MRQQLPFQMQANFVQTPAPALEAEDADPERLLEDNYSISERLNAMAEASASAGPPKAVKMVGPGHGTPLPPPQLVQMISPVAYRPVSSGRGCYSPQAPPPAVAQPGFMFGAPAWQAAVPRSGSPVRSRSVGDAVAVASPSVQYRTVNHRTSSFPPSPSARYRSSSPRTFSFPAVGSPPQPRPATSSVATAPAREQTHGVVVQPRTSLPLVPLSNPYKVEAIPSGHSGASFAWSSVSTAVGLSPRVTLPLMNGHASPIRPASPIRISPVHSRSPSPVGARAVITAPVQPAAVRKASNQTASPFSAYPYRQLLISGTGQAKRDLETEAEALQEIKQELAVERTAREAVELRLCEVEQRQMLKASPPLAEQQEQVLDGRWTSRRNGELYDINASQVSCTDGRIIKNAILTKSGDGLFDYKMAVRGEEFHAKHQAGKLMWDDGDSWHKELVVAADTGSTAQRQQTPGDDNATPTSAASMHREQRQLKQKKEMTSTEQALKLHREEHQRELQKERQREQLLKEQLRQHSEMLRKQLEQETVMARAMERRPSGTSDRPSHVSSGVGIPDDQRPGYMGSRPRGLDTDLASQQAADSVGSLRSELHIGSAELARSPRHSQAESSTARVSIPVSNQSDTSQVTITISARVDDDKKVGTESVPGSVNFDARPTIGSVEPGSEPPQRSDAPAVTSPRPLSNQAAQPPPRRERSPTLDHPLSLDNPFQRIVDSALRSPRKSPPFVFTATPFTTASGTLLGQYHPSPGKSSPDAHRTREIIASPFGRSSPSAPLVHKTPFGFIAPLLPVQAPLLQWRSPSPPFSPRPQSPSSPPSSPPRPPPVLTARQQMQQSQSTPVLAARPQSPLLTARTMRPQSPMAIARPLQVVRPPSPAQSATAQSPVLLRRVVPMVVTQAATSPRVSLPLQSPAFGSRAAVRTAAAAEVPIEVTASEWSGVVTAASAVKYPKEVVTAASAAKTPAGIAANLRFQQLPTIYSADASTVGQQSFQVGWPTDADRSPVKSPPPTAATAVTSPRPSSMLYGAPPPMGGATSPASVGKVFMPILDSRVVSL